MFEDEKSIRVNMNHKEFLQKVEQIVSPLHAECFSEETMKTRNLLIAISLVLVLVKLQVLGFNGSFELFGTTLTIQSKLILVLQCVCFYFLVTVLLRSYTEWKIWRLRQQPELHKVAELEDEILAKWTAYNSEVNAVCSESLDIVSKYGALSHIDETDPDNPLFRIKERLNFLTAEQDRLINSIESQQLVSNLSYLTDAVVAGSRTLKFRLWWEMLFPIIFGVLAILAGFG